MADSSNVKYEIPKQLMREIYFYIFDKSEDGTLYDGQELLEELGKVIDIDELLDD